ncbi:cytoplasm protein [Halteromyces radiatus]|uniref:cytoplasm protein n=1 Tax=Halteromyces radiatus TaxID=101107 RepID=UPI002220894D|nr:cytoplasm protein [Halteromyces radiatus]KAI8083048.1 cytoplasm protein [Halteromyces radiatus]
MSQSPINNSTDQLDDQYSKQTYPQPDVTTHTEEDDGLLTLRALVSTKEAGVIIGKAGKNVAELREATGVKAGVSKVVTGVHDRVLTITGTLEGVAKAYSSMAQTLLDNPITTVTPPISPVTPSRNNAKAVTTLRLLISHNLMGTVIGRQGAKIKHIQDTSNVRMTASKSILPQSTERVVEVRGTVEGLHMALLEIGRCLMEDKERAYGTILYNPTKAGVASAVTANGDHHRRGSVTRGGNGLEFDNDGYQDGSVNGGDRRRSSHAAFLDDPNVRTQHISIPSDMVGCIIGKGGSKISDIRRLSGSRISIAKIPHDETGERMFTIQGTAEANERALYLLYGQLESEKERRLQGVIHEEVLEEEEQQQQEEPRQE